MRQFRLLLAALGVLFASLEACPAAAENVLRWASAGGALTADPHAYDETPTSAQHRQVYEQLIQLDSDLTPAPGLAAAWQLVEPTTWEFQLRDGVRFHDGTPFTAADVVFSFARARTDLPVGFAGRIESIAEVRTIDRRTVHIETKFPDPQIWEKVSYIAIMSERWPRRITHVCRLTSAWERRTTRRGTPTAPVRSS